MLGQLSLCDQSPPGGLWRFGMAYEGRGGEAEAMARKG